MSVSLAEHVAPDAGAVAPDPRWRRQMVESLILSLLGLVLGMGSVLNWPSHWEWSRRGPDVPVVLVSTWWVLQWYSAIKLPRRDSAAASSKRLDAFEVWGLRVLATVYLVLPALWEIRLPVMWLVRDMIGSAALYSGSLAALAYFMRMRRGFLRLGMPGRAAQATVVAWLMALTVGPWSEFFSGRGRERYRLLELPSFQHCAPELLGEALSDLAEGSFRVLRAAPYTPHAAGSGTG